MSKILDMVEYINQVVSNTYDGALDKEDKPIKSGLKREKEISFTERRIMDGFKVKISGNKFILLYHSEIPVSDFHKKDFKEEVGETVKEIISYIKKEYKKLSGETLTLTEEGEPQIEVSKTSKVRAWLTSKCFYKIGGIKDTDKNKDQETEKLDKAIKTWMSKNKN